MKAEKSAAFQSCFDKDENEDNKGSFWKRITDTKEISEIEKRRTIIDGVLYRNRVQPDKESYFVLKQGLLYYTLGISSSEIVGIAKLSFQKIEVFQSSYIQDRIFGIRVYSDSSQTKLLSKNRDKILEWYTKLSPMLINRDFFSKYELKEMLGEGAFSQVYKVIERNTGVALAAKVIKHKMIYSDKRGILLMKQEIDIMRQLDHPNVVKLIEVQEVNNAVILILELLEGSELKKMNMKLSFEAVISILKALVSVIAYLETLGIVHRDLKPSNIIILSSGASDEKITKSSTKIIDFGLAAFLTEKLILTKCGTPGYIAPEILNQSSRDKIIVNPNVDVYSIGVIFYEMIYKCNPFKEMIGKNDSKKVVRKNAQSFIDFSKPSMYKNEIDSRVLDLMKEMTHRDERERPLASNLLHHPIVKKGTMLMKHSDYHPHIEENVRAILVSSPYQFKVNRSKFSHTPMQSRRTLQQRDRPPRLYLESISPTESNMMEDCSPTHRSEISPLNNRHRYQRDHSTKGSKSREPTSAASLEKRFRGVKRSDSPLLHLEEVDNVSNLVSISRMNYRTSSVGKIEKKNDFTSGKKSTAYGMHSSTGGSLFVLQKCENREDL